LFVPCGMSEEQEQYVCIKFCVKLGRNGVETLEMLRTAFGEQCLSHARIPKDSFKKCFQQWQDHGSSVSANKESILKIIIYF